jgi:hypothetical protein
MNVMSTVSVLPRTPTDINGFLSVVFIGPEKFDPNRMGTLFRVHKQKIWSFLVWLKNHNCLYADIELDLSILNQYLTDGSLPGFHERVVEDHILDAGRVFRSETAGFATHLAELLEVSHASSSDPADDELITLVKKMGVSDPECDKISGRTFTASAVRNLVRPDLISTTVQMLSPSTTTPVSFQACIQLCIHMELEVLRTHHI